MKAFINLDTKEYLTITQHQGKMVGIPSISTNKFTNENCIRRMNSIHEDCICKFCYVDKVTKMYKPLTPALTHNTEILTKRILSKKEINLLSKYFLNTTIARFESFGDLNNVIHLTNYINLARACKHTKFALFTKHYRILLDYFRSGKKFPSNVTLVLSSPFLEKELTNLLVDKFKKYHKRTITFTVTKDKTNKNINCGKRKCLECRNCYDAKNPVNVVELEK